MRHVIPESVVVVGAGLAGLRMAEQLRSHGYQGGITMLDKEAELPYDRPPGTKQVLTGGWEEDGARLGSQERLNELGVDLRLGAPASGLGIWTVSLENGSELRTDATVIATGARPRTIPGQPAGVTTLRTLADARALEERLGSIGSLLIVGGSLIAAEVATVAAAAGVTVTIVEALAAPCARTLGAAAPLVARLLEDAGVEVRTGARVECFVDAQTVELAAGEKLHADQVLVSVGSVPDVEWLSGSELPLGDGILAGGTGRVPPLPKVWALGHATSWWDQPRRAHCRPEHWMCVGDQAAMVAADILGIDTPAPALPYVSSAPFGLKVQLLGRPDIADEVVALDGEGLGGGPVAGTVVGYRKEGHLVAVAAFGAPAEFEGYRNQVAEGTAAVTTVAMEIED